MYYPQPTYAPGFHPSQVHAFHHHHIQSLRPPSLVRPVIEPLRSLSHQQSGILNSSAQPIPSLSVRTMSIPANEVPAKALPLKQVSSPGFLSKQALDVQNSLQKLKDLSQRKQKRDEEKIKFISEQEVRETFGKEKERPAVGKTPNFVPVSQEPQKFFNQSERIPSPIKQQQQVTVTQQSESELHKIYHYQETNESRESQEDKLVNIYQRPSVPIPDPINKVGFISSIDDIRQDIPQDTIIEVKQQSPHKEQDRPKITPRSEPKPKTIKSQVYSKMSPEEANMAYQSRKLEIKSHLQKTKQASKYKKQTDVSKTRSKVNLPKKNSETTPQKFETINLSRSHKRMKSRPTSPTSTPKQVPTEQILSPPPRELFQTINVSTQQPTEFANLYYSEKKQNLLQDILTIDKEIRQIEYQLIADSRNNERLKPPDQQIKSSTQVNRSLDSQIKQIHRPQEYKHRGDHLYEQGILKDEKKQLEIIEYMEPSLKEERGRTGMHFSTSYTRQSCGSQVGKFMERQKEWQDRKKVESVKSAHREAPSEKSNVFSKKREQLPTSSSVQQLTTNPQKSPQSSQMSYDNTRVENSKQKQVPKVLKNAFTPNFFSVQPKSLLPNPQDQDRILAVTQTYEHIVAQANRLKAALGLA